VALTSSIAVVEAWSARSGVEGQSGCQAVGLKFTAVHRAGTPAADPAERSAQNVDDREPVDAMFSGVAALM
jgi:hypothetical protein